MIIYTIYKIVNQLNGKVYIGFDSKWPNRQLNHKKNYKNFKKKHFKLYRAMNKHGYDNFKFEVLYQSWDLKYCLHKMEPYFIEIFDSFKNGYNMTLGGEGTLGLDPWNKGKKMDPMLDVVKKKISKTMIGKIKSKSTCEKLSKSLTGNLNRNKKLSTPDGIFNSATEASKYYKINRNTMYTRIYNHPETYQYLK